MRKIFKIAGIVLGSFALLSIVLIALFVGALLSLDYGERSHIDHEVEYTAEFTSNSSLNDTELLLPFPQDDNFQRKVMRNGSNVSIHNEWDANLSIVNTSRGEMLKANIGDFKPQTRDERFETEVNMSRLPEEVEREEIVNNSSSSNGTTDFQDYSSYDLVISVDYNRTLDTRNGLETEPHLESNTSNRTDCGDMRESCQVSTTQIFLDYEASNDAYLETEVGIQGSNSWAEGFSWNQNRYRQRFYNSYYDDEKIKGSQENWITLIGSEMEGDGTYRDSD